MKEEREGTWPHLCWEGHGQTDALAIVAWFRQHRALSSPGPLSGFTGPQVRAYRQGRDVGWSTEEALLLLVQQRPRIAASWRADSA